jgi:hypothetical protein
MADLPRSRQRHSYRSAPEAPPFADDRPIIGTRMAEGLGWPWALAKVFRILPLGVRDGLYELIAENRLRLFGKRSTSYTP